MKNKEIVIFNKVIKYCLDIEYLMKKYKYDFEKYQNVLLVAVVGMIVAVRKKKNSFIISD